MDEDVSRLFSGTSEGGEAATKQKTDQEIVQDIMNRVSEGGGNLTPRSFVTVGLVEVEVGVNGLVLCRGILWFSFWLWCL